MDGTDPMHCGARTRPGPPCKRPAGAGTSHRGQGRCSKHGGSSPNAEVAGAVALARREAIVMGMPTDTTLHDALLHCIRLARGHLDYSTRQRSELAEPMVSTMFGPKLHAWIEVEQQCMDRLVQYVQIAIRANIDERRVRLAEGAADELHALLAPLLRELGVFDDPRAPEIVARHLEQWERQPVIEGSVAA